MELIKPQKGTNYNIENDIQNLTNIEQEFEQIDNKITNDISSSIDELKNKVDNDITTAITELDNKVDTEIVTAIDNLETKVNTEISESITALDNKVTTSLQEQAESLKKEISDQIAKVVANSPEDFDTLKEISDWISGHSSDASTMNSAISGNTSAINQEILDRQAADTALQNALDNKVDKVSGKDLSTNDFTNADKTKLDSIEPGANETIIDAELSSTSINPVQNKVVNTALDGKAYRYKITKATGGTRYARITVPTHSTELIASCYNTQVIFKAGVDSDGAVANCIPLYYNGYGIQGWYATVYTNAIRAQTLYLKFNGADIDIIASDAIIIERGTTDYLAADFSGVAYKDIPRITKQLSNDLLNTVDTALSSTSTNPVQNKAIYKALGNKLDKNSRITIPTTTDLELGTFGTEALSIGTADGLNLGIDNNEIQARNNGETSPLYLNDNGGMVNINVVGSSDGGLKVRGKMIIPIGQPSVLEDGCIWIER